MGRRYYGRVRAIDPEAFQSLRYKLGFKQESLAEKAGVSLRQVQRLEHGEKIERDATEKIAAVLHRRFDELFTSQPIAATAIDPASISDIRNTQSQTGFILSVDGIILNHVGELVFEAVSDETIRQCRGSYQRSLEDFAFALVYGSQIRSKWNPASPKAGRETRKPESAVSLISLLPPQLYDCEDLDEDVRRGALLNNDRDREQVRAYLACVGECMQEPRFVRFCKDLLVREADMFLGADASLFREGGDPDDYKYEKEYYRHEILRDVPAILGSPAVTTLMAFLPKFPNNTGKRKSDMYAKSALSQFVSQVMLTHLTTMYEFEKNSERHHRWRLPYALRAEVTRQLSRTRKQRRLRDILVRHALIGALRETSGLDKKITIIDILASSRNDSPFNEIRGMLEELHLIGLQADEEAEKRASKFIQDISKAGHAADEQPERIALAHSSVLRDLAKNDPDEYEKRLYRIFPELGPPLVVTK
jgi:transcriptional regulator with XRE-family HTH domain